MWSWKHFSIAGFAMFTVFGAAALWHGYGWNIHAAEVKEPYLHKASTQELHLQSAYLLEREFAGEVRAGQSSELGFELAGQITELLVDEGDEIIAGQLLGRLDSTLLIAQQNELAAQIQELEAELETTRKNLGRIESLRAENLASEREQDNLAGQVRVLQASLERVAALQSANDIRLRKSELRAPFNSRIATRHVDSGVVVNAGAPVFGLVETGQQEVRAGVPVDLANTLSAGDLIDVRIGEHLTSGRVIQVGAVVNRTTQTRAVRVAIEEAMPPGVIAYLSIAIEVAVEGSWLPDAAVTEGVRGTWVVFAAIPDGDSRAILEARSVVIHHASAGQLYVSGAIENGDQILTGGLHRFAPGQLVKPELVGHDSFAALTPGVEGDVR